MLIFFLARNQEVKADRIIVSLQLRGNSLLIVVLTAQTSGYLTCNAERYSGGHFAYIYLKCT